MSKSRTPGLPPASDVDCETSTALVAAGQGVGMHSRYVVELLAILLPEISEADQKRLGGERHFKKLLCESALTTLTIVWRASDGPSDRALHMAKLTPGRFLKELTASALGNAERNDLKLSAILKPQFTAEKFISSKRRLLRAAQKYGLVTLTPVANSNCVAVHGTDKLHRLMLKYWKNHAAQIAALVGELPKKG